MKNIYVIAYIFLALLIYSCHQSDDKYPLITTTELDSNFVSPAYQELLGVTRHYSPYQGDVYLDQSLCTDEAVLPSREPGCWDCPDDGKYLFEHTWTSSNAYYFKNIWNFGFNCVSTANYNINKTILFYPYSGYTSIDKYNKAISQSIAELQMIRSFGYYYLIDLFGNVPVITKYDTTVVIGNNSNFAVGRRIAFDTVIKDIQKSIPHLSSAFNDSTFGRFNKWAAYALLAKMYINSEVWTGTSRYSECIAACDSIINSGIYNLEPNYFSNFIQNNQNSTENVFVIPYNQQSTKNEEEFYFLSLHYESLKKYQTVAVAWNGFCALPDHYHSFSEDDIRRNGWSTGPQFEADGVTPLKLLRYPYSDSVLNFTPDFIDIYGTTPYNSGIVNYMTALENNGARLVKYEIAQGLPHYCQGVPLAIFRYADILLLKAEAIMRNNGGVATEEAVNLANQIRHRAGVADYSISSLTLDELLAERGREFYFEGIRRQDLVRYGKFVRGSWGRNFSGPYQTQWYDRSGEEDYRNVFPIPYPESESNQQNPSY